MDRRKWNVHARPRRELRRLLVATDLSDNALIALQTGALLAADDRAVLRVIHCVPRHLGGAKEVALFWDEAASLPGANEYDELRRRIAEQLARAGVVLDAEQLLLRSGKPSLRIAEAAEEADADLVVLGGHTPRRFLDGPDSGAGAAYL